tara:strand:- start:110 stop:313 length:204 start_codon:yes stop_codon:yes gene_type:complete
MKIKFKTVHQVASFLNSRGGCLEVIRDTEQPEYAPHFSWKYQGWEEGIYTRSELLDWANENYAGWLK